MSLPTFPIVLYVKLPICTSVHVFCYLHVFMCQFDRDDLPQVASSAREVRSELLARISCTVCEEGTAWERK